MRVWLYRRVGREACRGLAAGFGSFESTYLPRRSQAAGRIWGPLLLETCYANAAHHYRGS